MRCLYCHMKINEEPTIVSLFTKEEPLCLSCRKNLTMKVPGPRCGRCHQTWAKPVDVCGDCKELIDVYPHINKIYALTDYNEEMKMLLHRYKFVKDYALSEVLALLCDFNFKEYDYVVPIPISPARLSERTYNQTTAVLSALGVQTSEILTTDKVKRQSELNRSERLMSMNPFSLKENVSKGEFTGKRLVIVDDIYTTGITVHQASAVAAKLKLRYIDVLTFSKA